ERFGRPGFHVGVQVAVTAFFVRVDDVTPERCLPIRLFQSHRELPFRIPELRLFVTFGGDETAGLLDLVIDTAECRFAAVRKAEDEAPAAADTEIDFAGLHLRRARSP